MSVGVHREVVINNVGYIRLLCQLTFERCGAEDVLDLR